MFILFICLDLKLLINRFVVKGGLVIFFWSGYIILMVGFLGNIILFLGMLLYWFVFVLVVLLVLVGNVGDMFSCIGLILLVLFVVFVLFWWLSCCCICLICFVFCVIVCLVLSKFIIDKLIMYLSIFIWCLFLLCILRCYCWKMKLIILFFI